MAVTQYDLIRLALYETKPILSLRTLTAGTYVVPMFVEGNSLLSSIYVKSCTGSVQVNYFDYTVNNNELPGERYELAQHSLINTADTNDRILVTKIHNKPQLEIVVTGTVEIGVYVTVVSSFASDIESNLKKDGQAANLLVDKGLPALGYDAVSGNFYFLPIENGALKITGNITTGGITAPRTWIKTIANANTETSIVFQTNMKKFTIQLVDSAKVQYSWQAGESGTEYGVLRAGGVLTEDSIIATNLTLYIQANIAGTRLHITEWT